MPRMRICSRAQVQKAQEGAATRILLSRQAVENVGSGLEIQHSRTWGQVLKSNILAGAGRKCMISRPDPGLWRVVQEGRPIR